MKNTQRGFIVPFLLVIIALLIVGGGAYVYTQNKKGNQPVVENPTTQTTSTTQVSNQSMLQKASVSDREKAYDAIIKSDLQSVQMESELYYGETGHNSYTGICSYPRVASYLSDIKTNTGVTPTCNSSATNGAASASLSTDSTKFWCVDFQTGFGGQTIKPLGTSTSCPVSSTTVAPTVPVPYVKSSLNDTFIQDQLSSTIKYEAQTYYSATGNNTSAAGNTYVGLCTKSTWVVKALATAQTANGGTMPTCNASVTAYAVSSPLSTDSTKFYCVDSKGFDGKTTTSLRTSTVCPAQ